MTLNARKENRSRMIVSHKHKFIFFKTRKTAGTSIEIALSKFCGEQDIITPITDEDEKLRESLGYRGPQNFYVPYSRYSLEDWYTRIRRSKKAKFYNHTPAIKAYHWLNSKLWNSYYKFCFTRNPWDKAISHYYFFIGRYNLDMTFGEYLEQHYSKIPLNYDVYTIDGHIAVDHVGLYKNLEQELDTILQHIGIDDGFTLPHAKGKYRTDRRPYQEVYGEKEKEYIANRCKKEIELMGYTFK